MARRVDLAVRFWAKVDKAGDCWEWTAYRNTKGYGQIKIDGSLQPAHRVSYELAVGPIPDGLQIDHLCRNKGCVNPAHLEPVTNRENSLRHYHQRTTCRYGHPLDGLTSRGARPATRYCKTCGREWTRRYAERQAAKAA